MTAIGFTLGIVLGVLIAQTENTLEHVLVALAVLMLAGAVYLDRRAGTAVDELDEALDDDGARA